MDNEPALQRWILHNEFDKATGSWPKLNDIPIVPGICRSNYSMDNEPALQPWILHNESDKDTGSWPKLSDIPIVPAAPPRHPSQPLNIGNRREGADHKNPIKPSSGELGDKTIDVVERSWLSGELLTSNWKCSTGKARSHEHGDALQPERPLSR